MAGTKAVLHAYFLSSCSWRVRAALQWKRIPYEERFIDIMREENENSPQTEQYRAINPSLKVPALNIDGNTIIESMAILQYLEDTRPEPTLTPDSPLLRARMREICETIVSGIQPLQNIGLRHRFPDQEQFQKFAVYHADKGLQTLDSLLNKTAGRYCVGDQLTLADLCLVPQVFNAVTRLKLDIGKYPTIAKLYENLLKEKVFQESHPNTLKPKK